VDFEMEAGKPQAGFPEAPYGAPVAPVSARRFGPTFLLCLAVLLTAVVVVVAKPLTAAAASTRARAHAHAAAIRAAQKVAQVAPAVATSPNWSGYVVYAASVNDGSFNQVSASWTEPTVTCPRQGAWTLFWVGFDGWPASDRAVEQGGTSAQCTNGVPHYSAFYEMWPTMAVMPIFTVYPGDQIESSVVFSTQTQQFQITVTDSTPGHENSATEFESCPEGVTCERTSAEWVAESPAHFNTNKWFPLADYGTMDFTSATVTNAQGESGPISFPSQWEDSGIERVAGGAKALAKVSTLENSPMGSTFADTFQLRK